MPKSQLNVDDYALQITKAWQRAIESILETGRLLIDAKENLTKHGEFVNMVETMLPFGIRTAQKLMAIARHPILSKTTHASHLPASYETLHLLSKFDDGDLEDMLAKGQVHAGMERSEAIELYEVYAGVSITWFLDVRRTMNTMIEMSKKKTIMGMLAAYLVDEDQPDAGPPIAADDTLFSLANWVGGVAGACKDVLGDGWRSRDGKTGVRVKRVKA